MAGPSTYYYGNLNDVELNLNRVELDHINIEGWFGIHYHSVTNYLEPKQCHESLIQSLGYNLAGVYGLTPVHLIILRVKIIL